MAGIELVADKESRRGFSDPHRACERVEHEAWERGLYCRAMGIEVVGVAPPLTIDRETADRMVEILADSIEAMEADVLARERSRPARPTISVATVAEFFEEVLPAQLAARAAEGPAEGAGDGDGAGGAGGGGDEAAGGEPTVIAFDLPGEGGGQWLLTVAGDGATVSPRDPSVAVAATVRASAADFVKVVTGELSGADAFVSERLAVDGDLNAAMQLMSLGII